VPTGGGNYHRIGLVSHILKINIGLYAEKEMGGWAVRKIISHLTGVLAIEAG